MFNVHDFEKRRKGTFGKPLYYFETLGSTNSFAEDLAKEGASEGTLVLANEQTEGKGRKANSWYSPPDCNLYFSLVLRPDPSRLTYVPFLAGLAVVHAVKNHGLEGDLKWPNDVLINEKKVCGILVQTVSDQTPLAYAILGCGINVNSSFPPELQETATSIAIENGRSVAREPILADFLLEFERRYERIDRMPWSVLCRELESTSSYLRGCEVEVRESGGTVRGITEGLDGFGGLILRTEEGSRVFYAGEIQSCRKK